MWFCFSITSNCFIFLWEVTECQKKIGKRKWKWKRGNNCFSFIACWFWHLIRRYFSFKEENVKMRHGLIKIDSVHKLQSNVFFLSFVFTIFSGGSLSRATSLLGTFRWTSLGTKWKISNGNTYQWVSYFPV